MQENILYCLFAHEREEIQLTAPDDPPISFSTIAARTKARACGSLTGRLVELSSETCFNIAEI